MAERSHGMSESQVYATWLRMKGRCLNPRNPKFYRYGGRGITICERWRNCFQSFLEDVGERPSELHSLDRINNDGNYEPGNVRWATPLEQARNRREADRRGERNGQSKLTAIQVAEIRNRYDGRKGQQLELCAEFGVSRAVISKVILRQSWRHV